MSQPAIIVEGISKRYRLGHADTKHQTFREMAMGLASAPFRKLRAAREGGAQGDDFWALKDINFEVQPGEVVGIIGRNGAGKSTLLKILSRITEPTTGQIRMRGRVASLLEVGTGFHPELTGRENIYLNGAILGMKRAEIAKKFDEIVAFAETEKFLDTPVKRYSSGMYVRLAFAVAAHLEPEILIVDEVLSVGDAEFQKKCLGKMQEVSTGEGRTVLFVSHNMAAVRQLCSRGIALQNGQIAFLGTPAAAISNYLKTSSGGRILKTIDLKDIRITDLNVRGAAHPALRTLSDAVLEIGMIPEKEISRFGVRLMVEESDGTPVADLDSGKAHEGPRLPPNELSRINIMLRSLPLRPGRYRLEIDVRDDDTFQAWRIPYGLQFDVEASLNPVQNIKREVPRGIVAIDFGFEMPISAQFGPPLDRSYRC